MWCYDELNIVSPADLMQDFKTGYLILSSAKSMFIIEIIGTVIGFISSPIVFWYFFYKPTPTWARKAMPILPLLLLYIVAMPLSVFICATPKLP
ncbi:hypothetical protein IFM89_035275 [Coptis chinensis]|uniref:Uncharacterized protein n=1 Tax=Coptis chinensis TaxID=261450 RepID=A0A835LDD6_9MAGN|nr:hypothetical protein IFM89_035275 [Coptis chinensis]